MNAKLYNGDSNLYSKQRIISIKITKYYLFVSTIIIICILTVSLNDRAKIIEPLSEGSDFVITIFKTKLLCL